MQSELLYETQDPLEIDILIRRNEDLKKINDDVNLVKTIFEDMDTLVLYQGEKLDLIEEHIEKADDNVNIGVTEISKAAKKQKTSYRCLILCFLTLILLFISIVCIFFYSIK